MTDRGEQGDDSENLRVSENPLLVQLDPLQLELLELICRPLSPVGGPWPTWDYVSRELGRDRNELVNAGAVLRSLPRIAVPEATRSYGLVWPDGLGDSDPMDDRPLGLTIAGLVQLGTRQKSAHELADRVAHLIEWLAVKERNLKSDPTSVANKETTLHDLDPYLRRAPHFPFQLSESTVIDILKNEYVTIWVNDQPTPPTATLTRWLRPFKGAINADLYLDVLATGQWTSRPSPQQRGDELALMLDYTSYVLASRPDWTVGHLAIRHDFRTAAALSATVANEAEFRSRIGDLVATLSRLNVPRPTTEVLTRKGLADNVGALVALQLWVEQSIKEPGDAIRAVDALEDVRRVVAVRNEYEHPSESTRRNGRAARAALGLPESITDWAGAWDLVRARVADGFDVLRAEAQLS